MYADFFSKHLRTENTDKLELKTNIKLIQSGGKKNDI